MTDNPSSMPGEKPEDHPAQAPATNDNAWPDASPADVDEGPTWNVSNPTVAVAQHYLLERCAVRVSETALRAYFAGNFLLMPPDHQDLAWWSRRYWRSCAYPTHSPASDGPPPRVLYVAPEEYDMEMMRDQLCAYGADVFFAPPLDAAGGDYLPAPRWNADPIRLATERGLDVMFLDFGGNPALIRLLANIAAERDVPCVIVQRPGSSLPTKLISRALVIDEVPMVKDIPQMLRDYLPPAVAARLALDRPMLEDWHGPAFAEALIHGQA